jgi:pyruvate dehydrogenase E1 component alpha subunit
VLAANAAFDTDRMLGHLRMMARIRCFEEAAEAGQSSGAIRGAVHLSVGQEAVAAGICANLLREDYLVSTHRGHGHSIAKGADLIGMLAELFGRDGGICRGKGGSMHIADFSVGMLGSNGVVAAGIPIAVGAAHATKMRNGTAVTVCFFGDGAVNRGPFLEGLNWARIFDLPILFVCEDNAFAATTRTRTMTGGAGAGARSEAIGIPAYEVDGNDVGAVDAVAGEAIQRIRAGAGPQFIHARTYRLKGHTAHDAAPYRPAEEVAEQRLRDPLALCRAALLAHGTSADRIARIESEAQAEISAALEIVNARGLPDPSQAWEDVQDIGAATWRA